jgi:hypothetical protein
MISVAEMSARMITEIEREQRNLASMVTAMAVRLISEAEDHLKGVSE